MNSLEYPSKRFIKRGKKIINQFPPSFSITILTNQPFFENCKGFLFKGNNENVRGLYFPKMLCRLFGFIIIHFYAFGAGYKAESEKDSNVVVYKI